MKKLVNEGNQIHNFISSSGSGTIISYGSGSGSDFLTSYGSGSTSQKVTVPYGSGSTTLPAGPGFDTRHKHGHQALQAQLGHENPTAIHGVGPLMRQISLSEVIHLAGGHKIFAKFFFEILSRNLVSMQLRSHSKDNLTRIH
jgi:hypothetical protein